MLGYAKYIPEMYLRYTICRIAALDILDKNTRYAWNSALIFLRYSQDMRDIKPLKPPRNAWDMPEMYRIFALYIPDICLRYVWKNLRYAWAMLRYTQDKLWYT